MMRTTIELISLLVLVLVHGATATFSIAGTDNKTNQVGAAGASCVPVSVYELLYHGVADHGVLVTQANPPSKDSIVYSIGKELLSNETDPKEIIDTITDPAVDNETYTTNVNKIYKGPDVRQYGVVDLMGRAAGYSVSTLKDYYYDFNYTEEKYGYNYTQMNEGGSVESYTFTAQGNIITNDTVPTLVGKFVAADTACDLAGRLFGAVEAVFDAVSQEGGLFMGDVRCVPYPAASAFIHVDNPDGTEFLHIDIIANVSADPESPFIKLKQQYDTWRSNNPCKVEGSPTVPTTVTTPTSAGEAPAQAPAPTATNTSTPTNGSSSAMSRTSVFSDSSYFQLLFSFLLTML
jgi:uncharacterized Ntn-hydrolase superfamily protein